jgi:hypothetical protein
VPDEPTLGEIARRLDDRIVDVRDDIQQLGRRIDGTVAANVYQIQYDAVIARLAAIEQQRIADAQRIAATRRWLIGAVIVPLVAVLVPLLFAMGGKG